MNIITEKDIHELDAYSEYTDIESIQADFPYDDRAFDLETKHEILWKIFEERRNQRWLEYFAKFLSTNRDPENVKWFSVYWVKYREELVEIESKIADYLLDLRLQESEITSLQDEIDISQKNIDDMYITNCGEIEELTGDSNYPYIEDRKVRNWKIDYSNIDKEDLDYIKEKCEEYLSELISYESEWHELEGYKDDLEAAQSTLEEKRDSAEMLHDQLKDWMYEI